MIVFKTVCFLVKVEILHRRCKKIFRIEILRRNDNCLSKLSKNKAFEILGEDVGGKFSLARSSLGD